MIGILSTLGLRGVVAAIAMLAAIACYGYAGHLGYRLEIAQASAAATRNQLDNERLYRRQVEIEREAALSTVVSERRKADAFAATVQDLRDRIARRADTADDAPTAPVLRDTIFGLQRTAATGRTVRQDELFNGRPLVWHLTVIVAGRVERVLELKDAGECHEAAIANAMEVTGRANAESLRGRVTMTCRQGRSGGVA